MPVIIKRLEHKRSESILLRKGRNANSNNSVENEIGDELRRLSEFCFSATLGHSLINEDMVLRFGNSNPLPIDSLDDIRFADSFKRLLIHSFNIRKPLPIQRHIWPMLMAGVSICCISGQRSGKSYSYLVPIMARLMYENERVTTGPLVVILCSSHKTANALLRDVIKLRGHKKCPQVVVINSYAENIKGRQKYDIVISTPSPLLRLISKNIITLEHCLFFICEEGDKTLELHLEAVKEIYSHYISSSQKRYNEQFSLSCRRKYLVLKTMIVAEKWTDNVAKFKETQFRPFVLFGTYFEALIASKAKCFVELVDSDSNRKIVLHNLVKSRIEAKVNSIVVMCCNMSEVSEVLRLFSQTAIVAALIDEKTHIFDTKLAQQSIVLVVVDDHIPLIKNINDMQCLIHYNLPTTKGTFNNRFKLAKQHFAINANESLFESFIILSKSNGIQVNQLYNFFKRCKIQIPIEVENIRASVNRQLCKNYASVGFCKLKKYCFLRHSFSHNEKPDPSLPAEGQVKGFITSIVSPNEVYIQINEYRNETSYKWKKVKRQISRENFEIELDKLKIKKSRYIANVKTEEIYAISIGESIRRVKVINSIGENFRLKLNLFHIDFGHYSTCTSKELIPLPELLKNVPPFVNKAHVWGIKPLDNEIEWHDKCTQKFSNVVNGENVKFITAWILKQVKSEFWINEVRAICKLPHVGPQLVTVKLSEVMIDERFAERNPQELPYFNLSREYTLAKWRCEIQQLMIQKAFLDKDCTEVYLTNFIGIDELYVQQVNFINCLQRLEKDLNASDVIRQKLNHFFVGLVCICFHESEHPYNRAQIEAVNENTVKVFFVDYGDRSTVLKENCFQIEDKSITTLPFQAIRCELSGLKGKVEPIVVYSFTRDKSTLKSILASKLSNKDGINVVRLYVEDNVFDGFRKYKSLGKWLVENRFAKYVNHEESKAVPEISLKVNDDFVSDNDEDIGSDRLNQLESFLNNMLLEKSNLDVKKVESRAQKLKRVMKKGEKNIRQEPKSDESETTPELPNLPDLSTLPESAFNFDYAKGKEITTILPFDAADVESSNESEDDFYCSHDSYT